METEVLIDGLVSFSELESVYRKRKPAFVFMSVPTGKEGLYLDEGWGIYRRNKKSVRLAKELTKRDCYVLISNADIPFIRSLYEGAFNICELEVTRWIRADGKRYKVGEVAITNYDVKSE